MSSDVEVELSRNERRVKWGVILNQTAEAYSNVCNLPCLSAFSYDPDSNPNRELSAVHIEFKADCEAAVTKAIGSDTKLFRNWISLVEGNVPGSSVMEQLSLRLGPIFENRGLQPFRYFKRIKKGRPGLRPVGVS